MTHSGDPPVHRTTRRILGLTTTIASRSPDIIVLSDEAFAAWPVTRRRAGVVVRIDVRPDDDDTHPAPLRYALPGDARLRIHANGADIRVDAAQGRARGFVSRGRLRNSDDLRYGVIEAATLFLLTARDRVPFHAAALIRDDHAVLLAGPSGAGKSTSAWAAARAGWSLLSEDCVYLQSSAPPRIWGWPGFLHLDAGAARFFPELATLTPAVRANGKRKIAVATADLRSPRAFTTRATLCVLSRTNGGPSMHPMDASALVRTLTEQPEPGFDRFAGRTAAALLSVVDPVAWRVDPGSDPATVPTLLESILRP